MPPWVMQTVAIETDAAGAADLAGAAKNMPDAAFDSRQVQAQVGDPDTWMFVAELGPTALTALSAVVLTLVRQRKVKYLKIGDIEFRDVTPDQVDQVMETMDFRSNDPL